MKVRIGNIVYTVRDVDELEQVDDDGTVHQLAGQIAYQFREINLWKALPAQVYASALWHEVIHGLLYQAGHTDHTEGMVIALGYGVSQVIKDNPKLVALTAE